MKLKIVYSILFSSILLALNAKEEKGVIMVINGENVSSDEFEYFYEKSLTQQAEPQTIDEYIELFKVYRMKVEEAKSAGKDTLTSFKKEMSHYRRDLVQPYVMDSAYIYLLVDTAFKRDKREVEASHIMFLKAKDDSLNVQNKLRLDSIHNILKHGGDFSEMARRFSQDRSVQNNGGYLGFIPSGKFPYAFETAVFETPEGDISDIVETPMGYHLVKSGKRRKSNGKVEGAHILKVVPKDHPEVDTLKKEEIDSIYSLLLVNPDEFSRLAIENSDDKGTAKKGGMLPPIGIGETVIEFEEALFALKDGEMSAPVRSSIGWHIIKRNSSKPFKTYAEVKAEVLKKIMSPQDPRMEAVRIHNLKMLQDKFGQELSEDELFTEEENWQYENNTNYRNLINEYTDGSLLYEVSLDTVWNKAVNDIDGLDKFYKQNKVKYKWSQPRAKGILVQAKNDSIATAIKTQCESLPYDSILPVINRNFVGEALAEKINLPKGKDGMVDDIFFGGEKVKPKSKGYADYFVLQGKIIDQPEELNDVKSEVIADYQDKLEQDWVKEMKKKYKVKVNSKELSRLKQKYRER